MFRWLSNTIQSVHLKNELLQFLKFSERLKKLSAEDFSEINRNINIIRITLDRQYNINFDHLPQVIAGNATINQMLRHMRDQVSFQNAPYLWIAMNILYLTVMAARHEEARPIADVVWADLMKYEPCISKPKYTNCV